MGAAPFLIRFVLTGFTARDLALSPGLGLLCSAYESMTLPAPARSRVSRSHTLFCYAVTERVWLPLRQPSGGCGLGQIEARPLLTVTRLRLQKMDPEEEEEGGGARGHFYIPPPRAKDPRSKYKYNVFCRLFFW